MGSTTRASGGGPDTAERRHVSDAAGIVVLGACAAWSLITAAAQDGRPEGMLLAVLAVTAGHAAGRIFGALMPVAAPCLGALAGLALVVTVPDLTPGPGGLAPLGHAGATAALFTLCVGAACCAAWSAAASGARPALRLLAAAIVVAAAVLGSTAGAVAGAAVLLCSLAAGRMHRRGVGIAGLALASAAVTAGTWAVAADVLPDGLTDALRGRLTPHRVGLWHDALQLAGHDAALGVGPDRFGELSPTAGRTLLPDGKPHSAPLQLAAEQGVIGVVLLAAVFGWVLLALWRTRRPTPVALTAGAAVTALAALAAVGNALSFTAVSVGAGLLTGLATARPLADEVPRGAARARAREDRSAP
ncbi:O-antigen ligase [Streptomyces sp. MUM 2J]|uniref:O-antigen ligase family protein n=1 Tax=Streptomyces sp. MUM 2J TaxID=2791987 RepID=UPI001F04E579|nr:O-antigen ligase family protein [Streptomyces sp. MUM 2J]MCH0562342.1 O-antigen ligase family protein [Streptomyces sp. MUM 2J]